MVDIGDFGVQHHAVAVPQRQVPDRIMDGKTQILNPFR
jgi:hypothetical protein